MKSKHDHEEIHEETTCTFLAKSTFLILAPDAKTGRNKIKTLAIPTFLVFSAPNVSFAADDIVDTIFAFKTVL